MLTEMDKLQHMLLLENDLYLQAVQHHKVGLSSLGLQEVKYDFASRRNTTHKKQLKAVIPHNSQMEFLEKAGILHETIPPIPERKPAKQHRVRYRKLRKDLEKEKDDTVKKRTKSPGKVEEPLCVSHPARRTSVGGTPMYQRDIDAHVKFLEREREEAITRNRLKERQAKIGTSFDIVGADGTKYVYDHQGRLVAEQLFEKRKEEEENDKKRHSRDKKVEPHGTALIEKTRRFVQELRKRVEMETVIDYRWYPGKFPATTIPPRAQSAGGSRPGHGNVKEFSSLFATSKSVRSPFRNGELPVLPLSLVCQWPEYRVMEEGDVVLTVEHCCHCWEHADITHHDEERYLQLAEQVKEALAGTAMQFAVRFYAVRKPIAQEDPLQRSLTQSQRVNADKLGHAHHHGAAHSHSHSHSKSQSQLHHATAFNIDYSKRTGAFEVQVAVKTRRELVCHLLHSKLFKGLWPSIPALKHLLERVLTEARFTRLSGGDSDGEEDEHARNPRKNKARGRAEGKGKGKGGRGGRAGNEEPEEEELPELHPEFDQREPPALDTEEPEPDTLTKPGPSEQEQAWEHREERCAVGAGGSAAPGSSKREPIEGTMPAEDSVPFDDADAAFRQYNQRQQTQHGGQRAAHRPPPSSFSSSDGEYDTIGFSAPSSRKAGVAKAAIMAIGAATSGLNALRARQDSHNSAAKISLEEAAQIAAGLDARSGGSSQRSPSAPGTPSSARQLQSGRSDTDCGGNASISPGHHPNLHKKFSAIGVLSRQNAGAGEHGRYLHIPDEDSCSDSAQPTPHPYSLPQSPYRAHRSPTADQDRDRPAPPLSRSASRQSQSHSQQFRPTLAALGTSEDEEDDPHQQQHQHQHQQYYEAQDHLHDQGQEDEQDYGPQSSSFSCRSTAASTKSLTPVATVVQLATAGLNHVRQRQASVHEAAEKMAALARMGKGVTQSEKVQSRVPVGVPQNRTQHPSLEMRKKLEIGPLSRQNAGKLVLPGDSSSDEDEPGRDEVTAAPSAAMLAAMSAAVRAVDLATAASEKRVAGGSQDSFSAAGTPQPQPLPLPLLAATSSADGASREEEGQKAQGGAPSGWKVGVPSHGSAPAPAHVTAGPPPVLETAIPASVAVPAAVAASTAAPAAGPAAAGADLSLAADGEAQLPASSAASPLMSATEMLQSRRKTVDKLLFDVSRDILTPKDPTLLEYGDDFEDFSPSAKMAPDGYEDLFENSDYKLPDGEGSSTL